MSVVGVRQMPKGDKKPVLEYFGLHGRGLMVRIVLNYANVDFDDRIVSGE
jgi:hypothetical protein